MEIVSLYDFIKMRLDDLINLKGSPKIYPKVRVARPEDVKSGLTLEHVGSDAVAEASNTTPTRM